MRKIVWANTLRGIAALCVVVGAHLVFGFWTVREIANIAHFPPSAYGDTDAPAWFARSAMTFAPLGVALFFFISGFVIAISLDRYSRAGFGVGRFLRILPVWITGYLVAVLTVVLMDLHFTGASTVELSQVWKGFIPGGSMVFGAAPVQNPIEWTLVVEIVFYLVCLIAYRRLNTSDWAVPAIVGMAVAATAILARTTAVSQPWSGLRMLALQTLPFLPLLFIGVLARNSRDSWRTAAVGVGCLVAFWWMVSLPQAGIWWADAFYKTVMVATIVVMFLLVRVRRDWRAHPVTDYLADVSYPLYVVHAVPGYATLALLLLRGVPPWAATVVAFGVVLALATAVHAVVEVPSHRLGQRLARSLTSSAQAQQRMDSGVDPRAPVPLGP